MAIIRRITRRLSRAFVTPMNPCSCCNGTRQVVIRDHHNFATIHPCPYCEGW